MARQLPRHYGISLTPTTHTHIPPSIDPSLTSLPSPFVVVVTGAGKGLGYHIALAYAKAGCSGLSISSRTSSDLDALEAAIKKTEKERGEGRDIDVLKTVCDVQSDESVKRLEEEVRRKWGRVDVVVGNAGVISRYVERGGKDGRKGEGKESNLPIGIVEDEDWGRVLDINLNGVWRISTSFSFPQSQDTKKRARKLTVYR
jgi:NAD(P)-dependent dehydrogenase (short-subunit alcohol dehydrogenase family)